MKTNEIIFNNLEGKMKELVELSEAYLESMPKPDGEDTDFTTLLRDIMFVKEMSNTMTSLAQVMKICTLTREEIEETSDKMGKTPRMLAVELMLNDVMSYLRSDKDEDNTSR